MKSALRTIWASWRSAYALSPFGLAVKAAIPLFDSITVRSVIGTRVNRLDEQILIAHESKLRHSFSSRVRLYSNVDSFQVFAITVMDERTASISSFIVRPLQ